MGEPPRRPGRTPWDGSWPPGERIPANGIAARSRRGAFATTWWGRRFVDAVEQVAGPARVARGRTYARAGQVLSLAVTAGRVTAQVQGSRPTPYATELGFSTWDAETRAELADAVAASPATLAAVLAGQMPEGFEQLTLDAGLALFPESLADARFACTCPDWGDPCKHAAAVVYLLAEWLDTEPFGVLTLRGVERDELLAAVAARQRALHEPAAGTGGTASGAAPGSAPGGESDPGGVRDVPLADLVGTFFTRSGPLPALADPAAQPSGHTVLDALDAALLGPGGAALPDLLRAALAALDRRGGQGGEL